LPSSPSIAVYALSFVIIGIYWVGHHRMFRSLASYDYAMVWLNLLFLLCIAFLPVANAVLARHFSQPLAVVFYAFALTATSSANLLLCHYASRKVRLVRPGAPGSVFRTIVLRSLTTVAVAALSIGLAFLSTTAAFGLLAAYALWAVGSGMREGA
jgi:uncharacterized membrane protein